MGYHREIFFLKKPIIIKNGRVSQKTRIIKPKKRAKSSKINPAIITPLRKTDPKKREAKFPTQR